MEILRKPFDYAKAYSEYGCNENGCGCDIYTSGGDCNYVDDGGCGCDD